LLSEAGFFTIYCRRHGGDGSFREEKPMPSPVPNPTTPAIPPGTPTTPAVQPLEGPTLTYVPAPPIGVKAGTLPVEFGDYELIEEVARGGMGVVYKARQKGLERIVALKMILPDRLANPEDLHRFRVEAEATARLQHPHIVTVYEVGEIAGQHFYSMDFIDGPSLSKRVAHGPIAGSQAARYVRTIARAMHHAHNTASSTVT
jgi:serine/threonine protein kinase